MKTIGNRVGLVGLRGMVGSVLMDRMQAERDFDLIEPVFFSTSNAGGAAPSLAKNETRLQDGLDIATLKTCDIILTTSGSTSQPKGVMHSDNTLLVTARALCRDWHIGPDTVVSTLSPFSHNLGVGALMTALMAGAVGALESIDATALPVAGGMPCRPSVSRTLRMYVANALPSSALTGNAGMPMAAALPAITPQLASGCSLNGALMAKYLFD